MQKRAHSASQASSLWRDPRHGGLNGWLEAGLFVLAISALTVIYAIAQAAGAHVLVFVVYAMAFAAAGMLAVTGLGPDPWAIVAQRQSWLFGISAVALEGAYFELMAHVAPAEASLLLRLSVPVSLLIGWWLLARPSNRLILIGAIVIVAAVIPILLLIDPASAAAASALTLAAASLVAIKTFASEFHPANRGARDVLDKLRVTGLVVLATAILGAALLLPAVLAAETAGGAASYGLPPLAAFWHPPTLLTAILLGAPVFIAMTYLTFSSVVKIGTESFLATSAFTPLTALLLQSAAAAAGLIAAPVFEWQLLPWIALGILGVLIVVAGRHG